MKTKSKTIFVIDATVKKCNGVRLSKKAHKIEANQLYTIVEINPSNKI